MGVCATKDAVPMGPGGPAARPEPVHGNRFAPVAAPAAVPAAAPPAVAPRPVPAAGGMPSAGQIAAMQAQAAAQMAAFQNPKVAPVFASLFVLSVLMRVGAGACDPSFRPAAWAWGPGSAAWE